MNEKYKPDKKTYSATYTKDGILYAVVDKPLGKADAQTTKEIKFNQMEAVNGYQIAIDIDGDGFVGEGEIFHKFNPTREK